MNFIKRIFAMCLVYAMLCAGYTAVAASSDATEANVASNAVFENWMPKYYNVDDSIILNNTERKVIEVSVSYSDDFSGYFWLSYKDLSGTQKSSEFIFSESTGANKTHTFKLYDAAFGNGGAYGNTSCDFALVYTNRAGTKKLPDNYDELTDDEKAKYDTLSVSSIDFKIYDRSAPAVEISTDKLGNIFFDGDVKNFSVSFINANSVITDFAVDYEILNYDKSQTVGETQRRTYKIAAGKSVSDTVTLTLNKYGAYYLRVSVLNSEKEDCGQWDIPFSINPKSDTVSYDLGINAHINDGHEEMFLKGLETLKQAGFGRLRHGYTWNEYYENGGVPEVAQKVMNKANELGYKITQVFRGNNDYLYGTTENGAVKEGSAPYMPKETVQVEGFSDYVYQSLLKNGDKISVAEIWNEPDLAYYSSGYNEEQGPEVYAALLKNVYDKVTADTTLSNVEIGGVSACEVGSWYNDNWTIPVIEAAGDCLDRITIHHYSKEWNSGTDCHDTMAAIDTLEDDINKAKYGILSGFLGKDINFHHTEFGASSTKALGKEKQAERLSQYLLSLRAYRPDDEYFIYDFSNDGELSFNPYNTEANFGLTESSYAYVPYAAKPSFVAVANINSLIGGLENVTKVSESSNKRVYSFASGDGSRKVYVMYAEEGVQGAMLTDVTINEPVTAYVDMYGNPFSGDVSLSSAPVYAICDSSFEAPEDTNTFAEFSQKKVRFTKGEDSVVYVTAVFPEITDDSPIGVKVYNSRGEIVQVEQLLKNGNGEYSFSYTEKENIGYSVWFGGKGIDGVYITSRDYDGGAFIFADSENKRQLTSFEQWNTDEAVRICAQLDSWENPDFSIYCAGYNSSTLVNVKKLGLGDMSYNAGLDLYYADIDKTEFEGAEEIGIYIFKSDGTLIPLSRKVELK